MVFEAHGMPFPHTELLLFNYAKVKTVFHSMPPLNCVYMMFSFHLLESEVINAASVIHLCALIG